MTLSAAGIQQWREDRGLSIAEAARLLDVNERTWRYWEDGERSPAPYLWRALEHASHELAMRGKK